MTEKQKLVVIGNGMAPGRMLEHLFETAPKAFDVTIFNAEPRVNYDRIMLSPVLSGEKSFEDIIIHGDGWYIEQWRDALQGPQGGRDRPAGEDGQVGSTAKWRATTSWSSQPGSGAVHHSGSGP